MCGGAVVIDRQEVSVLVCTVAAAGYGLRRLPCRAKDRTIGPFRPGKDLVGIRSAGGQRAGTQVQ